MNKCYLNGDMDDFWSVYFEMKSNKIAGSYVQKSAHNGIGLYGKKICMSYFGETPITVVNVGRNQISQIKTLGKEGYDAVQVAYGETGEKTLETFHLRRHGEFRVLIPENFIPGQHLNVGIFQKGQLVVMSGLGIGKGFISNSKKNNFSRGSMSHGSKTHRLPGSIGAGSTPGRVYPGKKMAGRRCNSVVVHSKVQFVDEKNNRVILKGSTQGKTFNFVRVIPLHPDCM